MKHLFRTSAFTGLLILSGWALNAQTTEKVGFVVREMKANYAGVKTINVDALFCKVEVTKSPDDQVYFQGKLFSDKEDEAYQLFHEKTDSVYTIKIKYPAQGWTSHSGLVALAIPEGVSLQVNCTTGSFKIADVSKVNVNVVTQAGNLEASKTIGSISFETVTGMIKVNSASGKIFTKSKTGAQFINDITGELSANSTDGEMTIAKVKGNVRSESTSGNHTIGQVEGNINAKAVNGYIKISEIVGKVSVMTFAGNIKLFNIKGLIALNSTVGEQVGTRLQLAGNSTFKTTEGKIKIQIDNKTDELTFNCKSTNAFIQVRGTSKKKSLKMGKGKILVNCETTTGGQVIN
jgi:hypothetical protein